MDIVVKGRNVEVPDHYRVHVAEKLHKIERYDGKIIRVDVELFHEKNPRQSGNCQRVEITCTSRGPVVRAEASSGDFYSALDLAATKLDARLRRCADRRRVHRGRRTPVSVAAATSGLEVASEDLVTATIAAQDAAAADIATRNAPSRGTPPRKAAKRAARRDRRVAQPRGAETAAPKRGAEQAAADHAAADEVDSTFDAYDEALAEKYDQESSQQQPPDYDDQPWHIVRQKEHAAEAMTVDDALFQMEMVGHDFFLFMDKESGRPSVVYRRHAYDYGVIALAA